MSFGQQLLSWRRYRGLTQLELSKLANIQRPYLSRLEMDKADPSLSSLRRLAAALDVRVGTLIEETPPLKFLTNEQLDHVARGALRPGMYSAGSATSYIRPLSRLLKERRASLGLYKPRKRTASVSPSSNQQTLRRMRADLGPHQWKALLRRIDKHAVFLSPRRYEDK
ncbi:MAG: hypothetical protein KCHDKBKB_01415 [Elusimicrobia bacterium]|nr:hypothetical protein [Elusimicrobiota bacterium]